MAIQPCGYCGNEPGTFRISELTTGETKDIGILCLPPFVMAVWEDAGLPDLTIDIAAGPDEEPGDSEPDDLEPDDVLEVDRDDADSRDVDSQPAEFDDDDQAAEQDQGETEPADVV